MTGYPFFLAYWLSCLSRRVTLLFYNPETVRHSVVFSLPYFSCTECVAAILYFLDTREGKEEEEADDAGMAVIRVWHSTMGFSFCNSNRSLRSALLARKWSNWRAPKCISYELISLKDQSWRQRRKGHALLHHKNLTKLAILPIQRIIGRDIWRSTLHFVRVNWPPSSLKTEQLLIIQLSICALSMKEW